MKISDKTVAYLGLTLSIVAVIMSYQAGKQNKKILKHTKDIKEEVV